MNEIRKLIRKIQEDNGIPYKTIPIDEMDIVFENMREDILGRYKWQTPDKIYINRSFENAEPKFLASTIMHELHHAWQHRYQKTKYFIGLVFRPLIERSAVALENYIDNMMGMESFRA